ncbi:MAG: type IV secretory pathway protein, partial [Bacteroidia bacterium]
KEPLAFKKISERFGISKEKLVFELTRRTKLLKEMEKRKIFDAYLVQKIINDYYIEAIKLIEKAP